MITQLLMANKMSKWRDMSQYFPLMAWEGGRGIGKEGQRGWGEGGRDGGQVKAGEEGRG